MLRPVVSCVREQHAMAMVGVPWREEPTPPGDGRCAGAMRGCQGPRVRYGSALVLHNDGRADRHPLCIAERVPSDPTLRGLSDAERGGFPQAQVCEFSARARRDKAAWAAAAGRGGGLTAADITE